MKRKVLFTLFLLLPILAARGQVYPFDEIQLVFPSIILRMVSVGWKLDMKKVLFFV